MKILKTIYALLSTLFFISGIGCTQQSGPPAISADNVTIVYDTYGQGRTAVVLVHGWSCDRSYWEGQVESLSGHHRVITVDLAGHGESGMERENHSIEAFGEDVASVVLREKIDKAVLVGHSMGGSVIIEAARRLPGIVLGLIGVDTYQQIEAELTSEQINGVVAAYERDFVQTASYFVNSMFHADADTAVKNPIIRDMASAPPEVAISALQATFNYDTPTALKSVRLPIFAIVSDKYPVDVEAARRHALSFDLTVMTGVGHFLMNEDAATFNQHLSEAIHKIIQH